MMTYMPPGGGSGAPPGTDPAMGGGAPSPEMGGAAGDPTMQLLMEIAMMVLGHPPQNEQEMMQVMQVLASMQGGAADVGGGRGAAPTPMPPANTALVKAVNGGF